MVCVFGCLLAFVTHRDSFDTHSSQYLVSFMFHIHYQTDSVIESTCYCFSHDKFLEYIKSSKRRKQCVFSWHFVAEKIISNTYLSKDLVFIHV